MSFYGQKDGLFWPSYFFPDLKDQPKEISRKISEIKQFAGEYRGDFFKVLNFNVNVSILSFKVCMFECCFNKNFPEIMKNFFLYFIPKFENFVVFKKFLYLWEKEMQK